MRYTRTFVLTLLFDDDQPNLLRGRIHSSADGSERVFMNEQELLQFLKTQSGLSEHPTDELAESEPDQLDG